MSGVEDHVNGPTRDRRLEVALQTRLSLEIVVAWQNSNVVDSIVEWLFIVVRTQQLSEPIQSNANMYKKTRRPFGAMHRSCRGHVV